jgi:hypothetical protein
LIAFMLFLLCGSSERRVGLAAVKSVVARP